MSTVAIVFNIFALAAVCATAAMHWFGIESYLYWTYPWWDIPTHILGGLTVGFWAAAVATRRHLPPLRAALLIVGLTFVVAIGWEAWEFAEGVSGGFVDAIKDLADSLVGALAVSGIYKIFKGRD
ncbi:MAG: hypothetical protein AAB919_03710 [Patescibacteria group bacterium]